ncbi:MAG: hypothetical protein JXA82_00720, partial [Sedimentisphaerales bacterium]|nr:hypothetical protein [Sedimentisphaerales bacterium]
LNENDEYLQWQQVIREYFRDIGLDIEGYDQLLLQQKRQREQWIREYEYDPDLYDQLMDQMRQDEDDWLVSHGFDQQDFSQWTQENEELVAEIFSKKPSSYAAVSFPGGPFSPSSSNTGPTDSSAISGNNPSDTNSTNQSRLTPELRQLLKDTFGWTDEFIDQAFGGN